MIVYAGKQYWNEFNNWDEALFEDFVVPRDSNMFKIKPWIQTQKNDWRTANSWIDLAQFVVKSYRTVTTDSFLNRIYLSRFWEKEILWEDAVYSAWHPYCHVSWNDIEITKTWTYIVQWVWAFVTSYLYKYADWQQMDWCWELLCIMGKPVKTWSWYYLNLTSQRQTFVQPLFDYLNVVYVWDFSAWDKLNVWFIANWSDSSGNRSEFSCQSTINLYRLS